MIIEYSRQDTQVFWYDKHIYTLSSQMGTLNQEVSELTKGLHHMMHLLQAHISVYQHQTSFPSYPYSVPVVSGPPASSDTPINPATTYCLHNDPDNLNPQSHQTGSTTGRWSCSGESQSQKESHQPSSPPSNSCLPHSVNSATNFGPCHVSENKSSHLWVSPSILSISPGYQAGSPGLPPHTGHEDSRHLSTNPASISRSQPMLCLQPPSDNDERSCLLSSALAGLSTHSLLEPSPTLNPSQASNEALGALILTTQSHNLIQDSSVFQIKDSHPLSSAPSTLPCVPSVTSLDSGSPQLDVLESCLPLGDPSALEHTSLECLLGNGDSMESRDSESVSSRRSSIGVQTQSTEQSWCLDLTDWSVHVSEAQMKLKWSSSERDSRFTDI